jgi:hypothetical protein
LFVFIFHEQRAKERKKIYTTLPIPGGGLDRGHTTIASFPTLWNSFKTGPLSGNETTASDYTAYLGRLNSCKTAPQ